MRVRCPEHRLFVNHWRQALVVLFLLLATSLTAHAEIVIEIEGVDAPLEENIRSFLSLSRYAERKSIPAATMERLERRIPAEVKQALEPLGFYDPKVKSRITAEGERWTAVLEVDQGRPVRLSEVEIEVLGPGRDESSVERVLARRELKPGLRLNNGTYDQVKGDLLRAATNAGYLDAVFTRTDLLIDPVERRATVNLLFDTGPRYHFGAITTAQDVINDTAMRRLLRMQEGDPYTLDALLRTQYVLDDSQYFASVAIDSGDRDRETLSVPVVVRATPNKPNRYAVSLGYATDTKARGKFTWDKRVVNDDGHRFKVELVGSSVIKDLSAAYVIPVLDPALEKFELGARVTEEDLDAVVSRRVEFTPGLTQVLGRWQRVLFLRLSNEKSDFPNATDTTNFLLIPGVTFALLPAYIQGGEARPYSLFSELTGSPSSLGSDASYLRLRLQGERVFDLSARWHLHLRGELGATSVDGFADLPASQRFFAGGDRSVRGFGLNELSPGGSGGRHLLTGSTEIQYDLPRDFGLAVFSDFGNAFNRFGDPLEYSAGIGVRYRISVANLGIDVAQPLSQPDRNPRLHLYLSTAF
jgi:translocation and assembly module TamA